MGNVTGPFNIGCTTPHPKACENCMFRQIAPDASFCAMYPKGIDSKPNDVYFYGKPCDFHQTGEPAFEDVSAVRPSK